MRINRLYRKKLIVLLSVFFLFVLCSLNLYSQTYGLKFKGHNVTLDKRTELDLTPDDFFKFQDEFEISFDYKTTRLYTNTNSGFFGYVFRIVNEDDENIDLLSTPTPKIGLNVVIGKSNTIIPVEYPTEYINNWIRLRVKFLLSDDRLIFYTPDTFYVQENVGFKKQEAYKIIFGANDYKQFKNSDVPSMIIKDIKISEKGKLKYNWPLDEKDSNSATDRIKGKKAQVTNPSWLINNHENWQLAFNDEIKGRIMVASDEKNGRIFMVGDEELIIYSTRKNSIEKIKYKNRPQFIDINHRVIYNTIDNKIYCYLIDRGHFYSLDTNTGEWNETGILQDFETIYRHHNSYFNTEDNSIYLFGGYGMHRYKNDIWKISLSKNMLEELASNDSVFSPRYLSGMGVLNDTLYILGGYGCETGDQRINPQSYFDLISYSIKDGNFSKKFEIPHFFDDMVVGNTMWINNKNRDYYALIFSKSKPDGSLQLIHGDLDSPEVDLVGNTIPFQFLDIRSIANLYYMPEQNKLYVYTSYSTDSSTQVAIYSIDNPPNLAYEVSQSNTNETGNQKYFIALVFVVLLGGILLIVFKKRKKGTVSGDAGEGAKIKNEEKSDFVTEQVDEQIKYNVIMFGGFQVFNKDLEDITNKFSPLLKELFLLIQLHTFKNNKGISSDKITEVLWYDKSEKSARNNRAVNIAKLRGILEEVGSCELSKKTGYWKIDCNDMIMKSDYFDFLNISASKNNLTKQKVNQLIAITQKGAFLSNVHYDWLDEFKASVSDTIIDTLVKFGQACDVKAEADFIIHLADSLFNFDVINEDAMILKCRAQYCMGKHSHAKATYQKFFKEYMSMYGQEYDRAFLNILEIKE